MSIKLDHCLKVLGVIDIHNTQQKINSIDWESVSVKSKNPNALYDDNLDFVLMFNLPDKKNTLLQNLFYQKDLLKSFRDEIQQVQSIVDEHYDDFEPKRIFINRLFPHKQIPPHIDRMYHHENTKRVHLPIIINDDSYFVFSEEKCKMEAGEVTEFNNGVTHSAFNDADSERVHMIFDFGRKGDSYYGKVNSDWEHYIGEE